MRIQSFKHIPVPYLSHTQALKLLYKFIVSFPNHLDHKESVKDWLAAKENCSNT